MSRNHYHLFEVTGVELEYMIVDRDTLNVRPICDQLLKEVTGEITADYENDSIAWSNELVNHVIELKTNGPVATLRELDGQFHKNVQEINRLLKPFNAMLLPGGAHPWMDPHTETQIWPHEYNEIYSLYNRIFDCRGHGWSNLQSTHINLPFNGDDEFARLHAAIRMVLPLIPALAASTPLLDGQLTGFIDSRMETYRHNQSTIPSIGGMVIPEAVFSKKDYHQRIFAPIMADIKPYDHEGVLDKHFLNSRGAIARFDRGAIEIRVVDIQESPRADLAIVEGLVTLLKLLVDGHFGSVTDQMGWHEKELAAILLQTIRDGEKSVIDNRSYLQFWGESSASLKAGELWGHLLIHLQPVMGAETYSTLENMVAAGTLSARIIRWLDGDFSRDALTNTYRTLGEVLDTNGLFAING